MVDERGEEGWDIGNDYNTDVGSSVAKGLLPNLCQREADQFPDDCGVGN